MHLPVAPRQRVPQALATKLQWVTLRNVIQLSAPSDGAAFGEKWSQQPVEIEATGPTAQLPPAEASQSLSEALLSKQFGGQSGRCLITARVPNPSDGR